MTQSEAQGQEVQMDHTYHLVQYVAQTITSPKLNALQRVIAAVDYVYRMYTSHNIEPLLRAYFMHVKQQTIDAVDLYRSPTTNMESLDEIMPYMAKYASLTRFVSNDNTKKYMYATAWAYFVLHSPYMDSTEREEVIRQYIEDIQAFRILSQPGQTTLQLYTGNKELAFVKYIADTRITVDIPYPDRYMTAIYAVRSLTPEQRQALYLDFEQDIQNKATNVTMVTVPPTTYTTMMYIPAFILLMLLVVVFCIYRFFKKKRK